MIFLFKKKKIVVDCFTPFKSVYEGYPIQNSMNFFPKEISKIKSFYTEKHPQTNIDMQMPTIKRCVGIIDYYKTGFIIPMWTDFIGQPRTAAEGSTSIGLITSPFSFAPHPHWQYKDTGMFDTHFHIKLDSPWNIKENSGVRFTWNPCTWNLHSHSKNFIVPPAVISFDVQCGTHINMFIDKTSDKFTLYAGTPMVHLVPLSDQEVDIKCHLVDVEEYLTYGIPQEFSRILPNRYARYKTIVKNKQNKKGCPFGFGK
jgi:hypothetical protein